MQRVHIIVSGVVQGVGFRYHTRREAQALELTGFVRNIRDGSVEIEAQGKDEQIALFISWVKSGPRNAIVQSINITELHFLGDEKYFEIT